MVGLLIEPSGGKSQPSLIESRINMLEKAMRNLDVRCAELAQKVEGQRQELDAWANWWESWGKGMTGYMCYLRTYTSSLAWWYVNNRQSGASPSNA